MTKWKNPDLSDGQHMTILGFGATSPGYWAHVVALQQARVRHWQEELAAHVDAATTSGVPIPEVYGSDARVSLPWLVGIDAHYLVYAADHALTICRRYQGLSGNDPRICRAIAKFEKSVGDLASMRDLLAHFEDYAVGSGRVGRGRQHDSPQIDFVDDDLRGEVTFTVGTTTIKIHGLSAAIRELVAAADGIWDDYVAKA